MIFIYQVIGISSASSFTTFYFFYVSNINVVTNKIA